MSSNDVQVQYIIEGGVKERNIFFKEWIPLNYSFWSFRYDLFSFILELYMKKQFRERETDQIADTSEN